MSRAFRYGQASEQYVMRRSQVFLKRTVVFSWDTFDFHVSQSHIVASISPAPNLVKLTDNPIPDSDLPLPLQCVCASQAHEATPAVTFPLGPAHFL